MNEERIKEVVELLKQYDNSSMSFHDARTNLEKLNYSDSEIIMAAYRFPYDGIPNTDEELSPHEKVLLENPKLAQDYAKALIKESEKDRIAQARVRSVSSAMLARSNSPYFSAKGISGLSNQFDLPFFWLYGIVLIVMIAEFTDRIPDNSTIVVFGLISIFVLAKILMNGREILPSWLRRSNRE